MHFLIEYDDKTPAKNKDNASAILIMPGKRKDAYLLVSCRISDCLKDFPTNSLWVRIREFKYTFSK